MKNFVFIFLVLLGVFSHAQHDLNTYPTVINKSTIGVGDQTYTLNSISSYYNDEQLILKNNGDGSYTVNAASGETIDGQSSIEMIREGDFVGIVKDPDNVLNWVVINKQLNRPPPHFSITGRFYLYTDFRWVTANDDNYGFSYYQWLESGGTGVNPVIEWEQKGFRFPNDTKVKQITISGRTNNAEVTDLEIAFYKRTPNPITRLQTGFDNDAEDVHTEIYRNFWWNNTEPLQPVFTGAMNDNHQRTFQIDEDFDIHDELMIYIKPSGNTAQRYFLAEILIEFE